MGVKWSSLVSEAAKCEGPGHLNTRAERGHLAPVRTLPQSPQSTHIGGHCYLLDLTLSIVEDIVAEVRSIRCFGSDAHPVQVTDRNDLVSLACCHSVLHCLVVRELYSTIGGVMYERQLGPKQLSRDKGALVSMDNFIQALKVLSRDSDHLNSHTSQLNPISWATSYTHAVRRLVLCDGFYMDARKYEPWFPEGKELGMLVASTVARSRDLKALIWDLPTGFVDEVWASLAKAPKLNEIWIRYEARDGGPPDNPYLNQPEDEYFEKEDPTFSTLPPLARIQCTLHQLATTTGRVEQAHRSLAGHIARTPDLHH